MNLDNFTYNSYTNFINGHRVTKTDKRDGITPKTTNTRMPFTKECGAKIGGGKFIINDNEMTEFWYHYYNYVFKENNKEYLTELQLQNCNSPILIDFDFRYLKTVTTRQHTNSHIIDIVDLYLSIINEIFVITPNVRIPIYVFEKPSPNTKELETATKDGIHMIIGLKMENNVQLLLRDKVLEKIQDIWSDLPIINTWSDVLDKGISAGTTGWTIYGSRKPNNQAYELVNYYSGMKESEDSTSITIIENDVSKFNIETDIYKLSARYPNNISFELNPVIIDEYKMLSSPPNKKVMVKKKRVSNFSTKEEICEWNINNKEELELAMDEVLNSLKLDEYVIKETHEYTQILPEKYYKPGSHIDNRKVAFALKNTDERLFLSWVMLRSKSSDFSYSTIPDLYKQWQNYKDKEVCLTYRSILYWCKNDAKEKYMNIRANTIQHFIEETISTPTDYDFAMVLYQMFKDKYVCVNLTNKTWYVFKHHRWEKDNGNTLRLSISREMYDLYHKYRNNVRDMFAACDPAAPNYDTLKKKLAYVNELITKLKKSSDKSNIFKEACEIFYDNEFIKKMDENSYLLCFTNGVVDIANKCFRAGLPEDYITKTTGIPYIPYDSLKNESNNKIKTEVNNFMNSLFPIESLTTYMWQHLSSVLIGKNINQTFNIYRGDGCNGKSLLTDLMTLTLGEYVGVVPINLITDKRTSIGSATSEIMQLKGVRYAIMQEPSKDAKINEGMMKQLTGDSYMTARALYCESEKFTIQFNLVVCTNTLFEIVSNDDGTWRRLRKVEFMSKFVDMETLKEGEELPKYHFPKDINLKDKLPLWAPIFASMLVEKVFETQGKVDICDTVMNETNKYRKNQDHISSFVNENVIENIEDATIEKKELFEAFKVWYSNNEGSNKKMPKGAELISYMKIKYGEPKNNKWRGIKLLTNYDESDEEDL
jgi:P4 family phage/plasmid primase-like protien